MITHENDLIHQRMMWLVIFQGLLFVALNEHNTIIICAVGSLMAGSIGLATAKANRAIQRLSKDMPDVEGERSGSRKSDILLPGSFIPFMISIAWALILISSTATT